MTTTRSEKGILINMMPTRNQLNILRVDETCICQSSDANDNMMYRYTRVAVYMRALCVCVYVCVADSEHNENTQKNVWRTTMSFLTTLKVWNVLVVLIVVICWLFSRLATGAEDYRLTSDDAALFVHCFGTLAHRVLFRCRVITTRADQRRTYHDIEYVYRRVKLQFTCRVVKIFHRFLKYVIAHSSAPVRTEVSQIAHVTV